MFDPEQLTDVKAGLARLRVEPIRAARLDPQQVFAALEDANQHGILRAFIHTRGENPASVRYQATRTHPGLLECIDADGRCRVGTFANGVFQPREPEPS